MKKRRGEARVLEDEEPRASSSQDHLTSSAYPKFNINRFTFHQVLGRGNFGKVVLASVPRRNTYVAIKIINKRGDNSVALRRERRILLEARDYPFLCHLYAAHQSQERAYFITEYLSGGSLEALIKMCGYLDINNVRFYTAEIVCGLQFLHGHNIVHRDIKPENIMVDKDGHIRIIDLGLAQDGVTSSNKTSGVTGTHCFMAPEVFVSMEYYKSVDWWSLGIVVSRMSSGRSPFSYGPIRKEAYKSITRAKPDILSWLDADVQHLIKKLLRKNPDKRLGVYKNIRHHPFFNTIVWEELEESTAAMYTIQGSSGEQKSAVAEGYNTTSPRGRILLGVTKLSLGDEKIQIVKVSTTIWISLCLMPRALWLLIHISAAVEDLGLPTSSSLYHLNAADFPSCCWPGP